MMFMAFIMLGLQIPTIRFAEVGISNGLSFIGCFPAVFMLCIAIWAISGRIVMSHAGIQPHRFGRIIPWTSIQAWECNSKQMLRIRLVDGRSRWIIGPATSLERNKEIMEMLEKMVGSADSLDFVGSSR